MTGNLPVRSAPHGARATGRKAAVPGRFRSFLRRPWVRRAVIVFGCVVGLLVIASVAGATWLQTDAGRRFVARRVETFVSDQIAGRMTIGTIDEMTPGTMRMRDVHFFAPGGSEVIYAREMDTVLDWRSLLRGRVVVTGGHMRGGRINYGMNPRGGIGLDLAFRTPGLVEDRTAPADTPLDVDNIVATGVELTVEVSGSPRVHAQSLRCIMKAWAPRLGAPVQMRMRDIVARMNIDAPIPIGFAVKAGTFRYDPSRQDRTRLDLRGVLSGARVRLEIEIGMRDAHPHTNLRLTVPGTGAWLRTSPTILQLTLGDLVSSHLDFSVVVARREPAERPHADRHVATADR